MSEKPRQIRTTLGRALFRDWLGSGSQTKVAEALGVHVNLVHRWLDGSRRPSLDMAATIERATSGAVPAIAWTEEDEQPAQAAGE